MTLRLVDAEPIPETTVPSSLRDIAAAIEAGKYGDVTRIVMVLEFDGGVRTIGVADNINPYDAMGLLEAGKLMAFADTLVDA